MTLFRQVEKIFEKNYIDRKTEPILFIKFEKNCFLLFKFHTFFYSNEYLSFVLWSHLSTTLYFVCPVLCSNWIKETKWYLLPFLNVFFFLLIFLIHNVFPEATKKQVYFNRYHVYRSLNLLHTHCIIVHMHNCFFFFYISSMCIFLWIFSSHSFFPFILSLCVYRVCL